MEGEEGPWLSLSSVAQLYSVEERSVQRWLSWGWIRRPDSGGVFSLPAVVRGVYAAQRANKGATGELEELTKREKRAKAELVELELEKARGNLIPTADVKRTAFTLARATRDALEVLPAHLSPLLAAEMDVHKVRQMLAGEIRKALEVLSQAELEEPEEEPSS